MALVAVSLAYIPAGGGGVYAVAALGMGTAFLYKVYKARKNYERRLVWGLFTFSIFYLFGLFVAMVLDKIIAV
jgi:heme O synthase-like polyprenyltransferase